MLHPKLDKWQNAHKLQGLLFFATALADALFDYTIDLHKASALNTRSRALELVALTRRLAQGRAVVSAFMPMLDELQQSIDHDLCLGDSKRQLLKELVTSLRRCLQSASEPTRISEATVLAKSIYSAVSKNYWKTLLIRLEEACAEPRHKRDLLALADCLIAELELHGYHRRHIYHECRRFFFDNGCAPNTIHSIEQIGDFFRRFDGNDKPWRIIFKVSHRFERLLNQATDFGLQFHREFKSEWVPTALYDKPDESLKQFMAPEASNRFPLFFEQVIEAPDPYVARDRAERRLQLFADICTHHDHALRLTWSGHVHVLSEDGAYSRLHRPRPNALHFGIQRPARGEPSTDDLIKRSLGVLSSERLTPMDTHRLLTAFEYHRSAIRAPRNEVQLLEMWSLLEGFVSPPPVGGARLPHYRRYLRAAGVAHYSERLIRDISNAIQSADVHAIDLIDEKMQGESRLSRVTEILCCDDREPERRQLYSLLSQHPLLVFRCFQTHQRLSSPKRYARTLANYAQRVEWQINRVYFMRNQIVHNSSSMPYLATLIENLHTYVDSLIECCLFAADASEGPVSLDSTLALIDHSTELFQQSASRFGEHFVSDSIHESEHRPGSVAVVLAPGV